MSQKGATEGLCAESVAAKFIVCLSPEGFGLESNTNPHFVPGLCISTCLPVACQNLGDT